MAILPALPGPLRRLVRALPAQSLPLRDARLRQLTRRYHHCLNTWRRQLGTTPFCRLWDHAHTQALARTMNMIQTHLAWPWHVIDKVYIYQMWLINLIYFLEMA